MIVEGVVEALPQDRVDEFIATYKDVWNVDPSEVDGEMYLIRPTKVFGFVDEDDGFPLNATRWSF